MLKEILEEINKSKLDKFISQLYSYDYDKPLGYAKSLIKLNGYNVKGNKVEVEGLEFSFSDKIGDVIKKAKSVLEENLNETHITNKTNYKFTKIQLEQIANLWDAPEGDFTIVDSDWKNPVRFGVSNNGDIITKDELDDGVYSQFEIAGLFSFK